MGKNILVTGGAGFIGSHTAELLINKGHDVTVLDNFSRGSMDNLETFKDRENFKLVEGDVRNRDLVNKLTEGMDVIFHIAARIHVDESRNEPLDYIDNNVDGTVNVLDSALKNNVKKVIYASSSEVYGTALYSPMNEDHPLRPASPYAASKAAADRICWSYYSTFGLDVTIVRNFNIFGPRQKSTGYGGVIAIFTNLVLNGKTPQIYGDGNQTRDYMYVLDAARAYDLVLSKNGLAGEVINFGAGKDVSLNEIAEKIIELCGRSDIKPEHTTARPGEVRKLCADTTKAQKLFNFKVEHTFDEGLRLYVDWFKKKEMKCES